MQASPFTLMFGKEPYLTIPRRHIVSEVLSDFSSPFPTSQIYIFVGARGARCGYKANQKVCVERVLNRAFLSKHVVSLPASGVVSGFVNLNRVYSRWQQADISPSDGRSRAKVLPCPGDMFCISRHKVESNRKARYSG